jgi:hypothetical protein
MNREYDYGPVGKIVIKNELLGACEYVKDGLFRYPNEGEGGELVIKSEYMGEPALNLGCGKLCLPGFINFDHLPGPGVDVVGDFEKSPLTEIFPNNHFQFILMRHIMEHNVDK